MQPFTKGIFPTSFRYFVFILSLCVVLLVILISRLATLDATNPSPFQYDITPVNRTYMSETDMNSTQEPPAVPLQGVRQSG